MPNPMRSGGSRVAILAAVVGAFWLASTWAAEPKRGKAPAAVEPQTMKLGDWLGIGEGKIEGEGFVQAGRNPLVVSNPALAGIAYILKAELRLPAAGAWLQMSLAQPQEEPAGKAKTPANRKASEVGGAAAPLPRIQLAKDGKSLQMGRQSVVAVDPARPVVPLMIVVTGRSVDLFIGAERESRAPAADEKVSLHFALGGGAALSKFDVTPLPAGRMLPLVEASRLGNTSLAEAAVALGKLDVASVPRGVRVIDGVPFYFAEGEKNALDVSASMRGLKDPVRNKSFYSQKSVRSDGRLVLGAPGEQYAALHLVAFCPGRKDHVGRMTVRIGHYGDRAGILEDVVVRTPAITLAPEKGQSAAIPIKFDGGKQGYLHHLRVPLGVTANVKEFARFDIEFTRDMNVHIGPPDPAEYGKMPVGMPSDVVILAATLEPSPVTMSYRTDEPGNVFFDDQKVAFKLTLANRSSEAQEVRASAIARGPGTGEEWGIGPATLAREAKVVLKPGESQEVTLDVTPGKRGWYACGIGIDVGGRTLQQRDTSFAVLAPDTRKATHADSPFGVWEFWFPHSVARRPDQVEMLASLIRKGGWRWTYGGSPAGRSQEGSAEVYQRMREKYQIVWALHSLPEGYQRGAGWFDQAKFDAMMPEAIRHAMAIYDPYFKVLHESRSSTDIVRRFSEFLGGTPYDMPPEEKQKLEAQYENVKKYTLGIKRIEPKAKVVLINDYPAVAAQYLSRGFPKEAFDVIGLESAMFMRQPERQPDWMCLLGTMHQMKRMLAKYGYADKPIWTTEALYHPTEAGGLSLHEQGVIAVREAMMALQLGVARMAAAGIIKDPSDDYHWSNWGSAGFCFRDPEINPKPSYAMYAWMTQVLDQARPAGKLAVPNTSLHVVDFKKPDGAHVYAVWTAKGVQSVSLKASGKPAVYDVFGNTVSLAGEGLALAASPTPLYVTGAVVESVTSTTPIEQKSSAGIGKLLLDFDKPEAIKVVEGRNEVLDAAWETPRLKGNFDAAFVTEDGATALKVTLKPDDDPRKLLPRYVECQVASPIELEGRPGEFALRVKGNSGWGRIMFEVVDAKGRVWTSCGNQYSGATNAADSRGQSFISFEGWNTIRFPVVGMYPSVDQTCFWPENYNWWPTNAPEAAEVSAKAEQAKAAHEAEVKAHAAALEQHAAAHAKWQTEASAAKAAGKPVPAEPRKPAPPAPFRPVRNMGIVPVDYPLKLTKLIVEMRPSILYLDEERPVARPTIYIDDLWVTGAPAGR